MRISKWLAIMTALTLTALLLLSPAAAGDQTVDPKWGPFRGRIIDMDTGHPIPGAAIVVIWLEAVPTPVQTDQKYYDAREAVADAEGRFEIPRRPAPLFSFRVFPPDLHYIAPGYVPWGSTTPCRGRGDDAPDAKEVAPPHRAAALELRRQRTDGSPMSSATS